MGTVKVGRRRARHSGARGDLRGAEGARDAQGRRACLSCSATTPRCGWEARSTPGSRPRPRPRSSLRSPLPTRPACLSSSWAAAATWWSPTRGSPAPSCTSPPEVCGPTSTTPTPWPPAAVSPWRWPQGRSGTTWSAGRSPRSGSGSKRCPESPARSVPRPSRTSAPTGRRSSDTVASVRTWDRRDRTQRTFAMAECRFGYRTSRFKAEPERYVVLEVTFQLRQGSLADTVRYAELARALAVEPGDRAPLADVPIRRARAASEQGDGAGSCRPRHLERRLLLHQPAADARSGGPPCRARLPAGHSPTGRSRPAPRG